MKFLQSLLIGASYISFLPIRSLDLVISKKFTCSMSSDCSKTDINYTPGLHSAVFVTTPDKESAGKIAHGLISQDLAACVNIIPQITSIYKWEGKVNEDSECLLMIKTRTTRVDELSKYVRENHPYSVAEVISLPIQNGNFPYLDWISKTVSERNN